MNKIIGILLVGLLGFLGCSDNDGKLPTVTGADKIASFQSKHKPTFDVNEQGQAVWTLISNDSTNIYLFSNNNTKLIRNTPSIIEDLWIEDSGEILWIESVQNGFVIYTYYDGKTTNVPIEDVPSFMNIQMNANGTVLWTGLGANDSLQIYKYQNGSIEQMTGENNNLLPQINDKGDITWIELVGEMAYINFLSRDEVIYTRINEQKIDIPAKNEMPSYFVDMNENGDLVWNGTNDSSNLNQVFLFKDGNINQITEGIKECVYPQMNDNGDIVYHAFYDNANEIDLFGFGNETRSIARANKYFSPPQINNDGFILWESLDNDVFSFLLRDDNNDIVKILMESKQGYFDSDLFLANDRYVCFLDGEWVEDEFEYNSLYLFDLNNFHLLTDSIPKPFQDEKHALAETDGLMEQIPTVSQDRDNIESLMPTTETIQSRDSAESNEVWSFTVIGDTRGLDHATWGARALADPWNEAGIIWAVQAMHSILQPKPEIVLMNGDMESWMYKTGTTSPFIENLKTWDSFFQNLGRSNVYPVKGNHELFYAKVLAAPHRTHKMQEEYTGVIRAKYTHVWNAKSLRNTGYQGLAYYFTHRDVFFVVFDSNYMSPGAAPLIGSHDISNVTQEQIDWFKQVVTSAEYKNANFRFAICHYTLYPSLEKHKANNTKLLELLGQHKFDAFFGACEHLYTDKFNVTINGVTYYMPVVTVGSMAKASFDTQSSIKNPGDFNKIITKVPGFLRVRFSDNTFFIDLVTPTSYERKAFAGWKVMSTIKVERTAGNPIISGSGLGPGRYNAIIPNSVPSCDCYHRSGGCYIKRPPGPGTACHCTNMGIFGCAPDTIVRCQDYLNYYCLHPDTSKNTCLQGGGNCGGY